MKRRPILRLITPLCVLAFSAAPALAEVPVCEPIAFPKVSAEKFRLGQSLFYDPILSGSKTVSCATCHHPKHGTSDGVSLSLGDGGVGLGPARKVDPKNLPEQRIPRNATALFNLGAPEFSVMFADGRLEGVADGLRTPLGEDFNKSGLSVLAAQTMFPVLSPDEMAGHYQESDMAQAVRQGLLTHDGGAWAILTNRIEAIPAYRTAFDAAYGTDRPVDFAGIADALAAFIATEWRADNSPFDRHICDGEPLAKDAALGMDLFYGKAGCAECHTGRFQTDHDFHAIAMPQLGPGKAARFESHARDEGRMRVTGRAEDAYAFRTPSLRNITASAPYGHAGAYATLEGVVRHHLDPVKSLAEYDRTQAVLAALPDANDFRVLDTPRERDEIAAANTMKPVALSDAEVDAVLAFLTALTDEAGNRGRLGVPDTVPSGLQVER
jgi:cytochrome c peroxidase